MFEFLKSLLKSSVKPSEDHKFKELIPKSILEDFDEILSEFKPKELISYLPSNEWLIRGNFADRISVCKVYNKILLSPSHRKYYLISEVNILKQIMSGSLKNDNLVNVYKIIENERNVLIFTENYSKTAVELVMKRGPQNEEISKIIFKQILCAIDYLHSNGISHRDIKLENIYLKDEKNLWAKLGNFTCALVFNDGTKLLLDKTWVGTEEYMPPETLERKLHDPRKSDIWTIGVCLFILLHNCFPFGSGDYIKSDSGRDQMLDKQLLRSYLIPKSIKLSSDCIRMYRYLMTPEFESRPDAKQALSHNWLKTSH